ncbi:MAG: hypothetical protein EA411_07125 [Saprospirales bacterium]|nr:MAG: hypothetical protein EA411_07125 [Saprospirales bacterium]
MQSRKTWPFLWGIGLAIFFLSVFLQSCQEPDKDTAAIFIKAASSNNLYPEYIDNLLLISSDCDGVYCLSAFDPKAKEIVWSFLDNSGSLEAQYTNLNFYSFENLTILPMVDHLLVIDHNSGELLDTVPFQGKISANLFGGDRFVYPVVTCNNQHDVQFFSIDLLNGEKDTILSIPASENERIISVGPVTCSFDPEYLFNSVLKYNISDNRTENYLLRWNTEFGATDSIPLSAINFQGYGVTRPPLTDTSSGKTFWHLTNKIVAFNHHDNVVDWSTDLDQVALASRPVLFQDKIIYPTEANFFLVLNKYSGEIVDTIENTPSFPGRIKSVGNKLLLIGGVDGRMYELKENNKSFKANQLNHLFHEIINDNRIRTPLFVNEDQLLINVSKKWVYLSPNYID